MGHCLWGFGAAGVLLLATAGVARGQTRPGFSPPLFPLELRAQVDLGASPLAAPVSDGQRAFVALRPATLQAVNLDTGSIAWRSEVAPAVPLTVADGRVLVATAETLEAVAADTGQSVWRVPLNARPVSAPTSVAADVVLALVSGDVLSVSRQDGTRRWQVAAGDGAAGPIAVADSTIFVGLADGRIVALAAADGARRWEQRLGGRPTGLAWAPDRLYAGGLDNFFYCLDARNGRIRWRWRTGADVVGNAVVDARNVYFVSLDNLVRALDRDSGVQRWKKPLAARPVVGPALVGDTLLVSGLSPELRGLKAASGEAVGRYLMSGDLQAAPHFVGREWAGADLTLAIADQGALLLLGRRLAPGLAPLAALPGTPVEVTVAPPPK